MLRQNVEALDQQRQMMDVLRASDFCVTSDTTRLHVAAKMDVQHAIHVVHPRGIGMLSLPGFASSTRYSCGEDCRERLDTTLASSNLKAHPKLRWTDSVRVEKCQAKWCNGPLARLAATSPNMTLLSSHSMHHNPVPVHLCFFLVRFVTMVMSLLICEPLRFTAFFVIFLTTLVVSYLSFYTTPLLESLQPEQSEQLVAQPEVPEIWKRLGAKSIADVRNLSRTLSRRAVLTALVDEVLAPWSSATSSGDRVPILAALIDSMEVPNKASTARIRLSGDGRVLFRVVEHWEKTYRLPRLVVFLDLLVKMLKTYPALSQLHCEFYLNTADGPRATIDSMSQELGALPIFSFRTEHHYIDIPVPDPVEHGSKVTGAKYVIGEDKRVKWEQKKPRAVFRGTASCIQKHHFGNWHLNSRVRVSSISTRFPELLDAGVTKWVKLSHNTSVEDIERSANISLKVPLTLEQHMEYKYILDVDGGLGSSRKRWMLKSGSASFFQKSAVSQWYEALLSGWVHYVPVDRWFRDLVENIRWAQQNDEKARQIAENGVAFAERFLTEDAILEYLAILLQKYSELQPDARHGNASVRNPCIEKPSLAHGPMGCRTGWFQHFLNKPVPFNCRHKPDIDGSFICFRPHPISGRKQVKRGIYRPYPYDERTGSLRNRPVMFVRALPRLSINGVACDLTRL